MKSQLLLKTEERGGLGYAKAKKTLAKAKQTLAEAKQTFVEAKGEHPASTTLRFAKVNLSFTKEKAFTEAKEDKEKTEDMWLRQGENAFAKAKSIELEQKIVIFEPIFLFYKCICLRLD